MADANSNNPLIEEILACVHAGLEIRFRVPRFEEILAQIDDPVCVEVFRCEAGYRTGFGQQHIVWSKIADFPKVVAGLLQESRRYINA